MEDDTQRIEAPSAQFNVSHGVVLYDFNIEDEVTTKIVTPGGEEQWIDAIILAKHDSGRYDLHIPESSFHGVQPEAHNIVAENIRHTKETLDAKTKRAKL